VTSVSSTAPESAVRTILAAAVLKDVSEPNRDFEGEHTCSQRTLAHKGRS